MATINTSPRTQGASLKSVRDQYPTLSNPAQVAVWKYGADMCIAVARSTDDGSLRGMQRNAARQAGMELEGANLAKPAPKRAASEHDDIIGEAPVKRTTKPNPYKPGSTSARLHDALYSTKRATGKRPYSSAHTAKFTRQQLDTMAEIAASARKHASKG